MADARLQVRLKSPWTDRVETELAVFSCDITAEQADAPMREWAPEAELFRFHRRYARFCCEWGRQFNGPGKGHWATRAHRPSAKERLLRGYAAPGA